MFFKISIVSLFLSLFVLFLLFFISHSMFLFSLLYFLLPAALPASGGFVFKRVRRVRKKPKLNLKIKLLKTIPGPMSSALKRRNQSVFFMIDSLTFRHKKMLLCLYIISKHFHYYWASSSLLMITYVI